MLAVLMTPKPGRQFFGGTTDKWIPGKLSETFIQTIPIMASLLETEALERVSGYLRNILVGLR